MKKVKIRSTGTALALALLICATGCRSRHGTPGTVEHKPNTPDYASNLQPLVASSTLPALKWPNYSDYQPLVQKFYNDRGFELAWTRDGKPTAQATAFIQAIQDADKKGLNPEDYDASRWSDRIQQLNGKPAEAIANFDVAMTISVMRYISDLHVGRVSPLHFNSEIDTQSKKYDLPQFLTEKAVDSSDVPALLTSVEPDSDLYRQTEQALVHYLDLAKQQGTPEPLPDVSKALSVKQPYPAAAQLWQRLQLEGDAPSDGEAPTNYSQALSDAVKNYQHRHGIAEDGKLTPATLKSINVPLSARVTSLQDSLERWRWLPDPYLNPSLMVNLPEFLLRGFNDQHHMDFTMKVVDGKVKGDHETPVFTHMMKYLIFRPYWNVPVSIAKKELVPHMNARPGYLEAKNYEVTDNKGKVLTEYTTHQVEHSMVQVREKPGPGNSLGLVKFMFPNQYDIYLHSTPETFLFARTRRDYSHGCVRVQHPDDLAAWVLNGQQGPGNEEWDLQKVQDAMNTGKDNNQVNLKKQLPVVIFYLTAFPAEDGQIHFFDDIYMYDQQLNDALAKGMPYPQKPEPITPKTKPGDTV
ncbi:L,D-transpeptidase family protein [Granulicella arctica]|uniref:L,D-transpeptidase family protein n=1 Tax=Granulicella arctica TaxID=940613 RepID=UPI0021E00703|nr:L,D-transpeptidase family protein [Granulicella arctica]